MALYLYSADGSLHGWSPNDDDQVADAATLAAAGLTLVTGLPAQDATHVWSASAKTVVTQAAPVAPVTMETGIWIMRFTPQEFQAIMASTDPVVQQFVYALNHTTNINLTNSIMTTGVSYLVTSNLIQSSRVAALLASP